MFPGCRPACLPAMLSALNTSREDQTPLERLAAAACCCCNCAGPQAAGRTSGVTWSQPTFHGNKDDFGAQGRFSLSEPKGWKKFMYSLIKTLKNQLCGHVKHIW